MPDSHRTFILLYDCANCLSHLRRGKKVDQLYRTKCEGKVALLVYLDHLHAWVECITSARNHTTYARLKKPCESVQRQIQNVKRSVDRKCKCKRKTIDRGKVGRLKASITRLKKAVAVARMPLRDCQTELEIKGDTAFLLWPE
jgi:hypothetical protein